ncbi:MAG: hypothetical protein GY765_35975 [bacterium]|nr:hypothetical protein [bacterium]
MRKVFLVILIVTLLVGFTGLLKAEKKEYVRYIDHRTPVVKRHLDAEAGEAWRARYLERNARKKERQKKHMLLKKGNVSTEAANFAEVESYGYLQGDYSGDLLVTGVCQNNGTSGAIYVQADVIAYDSGGNALGDSYTYVYGGTNVIGEYGSYNNAIAPGEMGFYKIWISGVPYGAVSYVVTTYDCSTQGYTPTYATVGIDGSITREDSYGSLKYSGTIKNGSAGLITYYTEVMFGIVNASGKLVDTGYTFADGIEYNYGSGTTDTAISPGSSAPFDLYFTYATYSDAKSYFHAFEWHEARTSTLPEENPPFGMFESPVDGANVASSIAVTGWALDDSGVEAVKIYRNEGSGMTYVGDATFVEGARPDLAAAYPYYPSNTRGGWGYMLLTHFLPNGGNGTYTLYAVATDSVGKTAILGSKTITSDNANAVKPFGAIDTPAPGGTISGNSYTNVGWALTPMPNSIATDGSTIGLYIDGYHKAWSTYNLYRSDIATLFPGYANSDGAMARFFINTNPYPDGMYQIFWVATDSGGNADGIGSRFFNISNSSRTPAAKRTASPNAHSFIEIQRMLVDKRKVIFKKGFNTRGLPAETDVDQLGVAHITLPQWQRIAMNLGGGDVTGYLAAADGVHRLPIGSTLKNGTFYWIPGEAFLGDYNLIFVIKGKNNKTVKKHIRISVVPKGSIKK